MSAKAKTGPDFEKLYRLAERQGGFFTAHQAVTAGYSRPNHTYHVKTKDWERCERGIYRLSHFPALGRQDVIVAYLWCSDIDGKPQGVISHDTALEVHKLSTWVSPKYHLTVKKGFRKRGESKFRVQFHYSELNLQDTEIVDGFRVTKPLRTIVDLLDWGQLELRHLKEALSQALQNYQILPDDIRQLPLSAEQIASFKRLLQMFSDPEIRGLL